MLAPTARSRLTGLTRAAARWVSPEDVVAGHLTGLLAVLWFTGGVWLLAAWLLGVFDAGWQPGIATLAAMATALGGGLFAFRHRRLPVAANIGLTLLGSVVIAMAVYWAGPSGAAAVGVLFVYVTCFAWVALSRYAVALAIVSAAMHLVALVAAGQPAAIGIWVLTWGAAVVTGLLAGTAVEWLRLGVELLRDVDEHKSRFIATTSHELRTPLTAILGSTETLQHRWALLGDTERQHFISMIDRQAARQLRLVNDVLTMSTLMRGTAPPTPRPVSVEELVVATLESLRFPVRKEIEGSPTAMADPNHLHQVLENLLVNADRYGGHPILLRARVDDHAVRIDVVDHGPGIQGGFEHLLEPFVQGDSGDRRTSSGVGLGLTICRDLLAANEGRLDYVDTPGGGATIRLHLRSA